MFSCPLVETWSSGANTYCPHWPELGHSLGRSTRVPQRSALANPAGGGRRVWDERDPVSGSSTIASCISFILGKSHPLSFSSACRSSVSALLCRFAQFFHCVELLCFCALLCFVPCSVLCFTLFCSSLSSSVLLCSVGLFCFAAKPCFLPCFAHKLSWLCFAYEYFGARLFSYFGLPSVLVLCIFC